MPPVVALILCLVLVMMLLRIERRRNPISSGVLWLPTAWLLLCASKPLGRWFQQSTESSVLSQEEGSPLDRLALGILICLGVFIINRRQIECSRILKDNFWLILLLLYLGTSALWSDFPLVSFKRWIRVIGAIPIAMVILSELSPLDSLESVLRRCMFMLIPFSLLLIKYFPDRGIEYAWDGTKQWVGVANQKNGLGVICALSAFFTFWALHRDWRSVAPVITRSVLFADGFVLAISLYLLRGFQGTFSATSIGFLVVGIACLMFLYRIRNYAKPMATILVIMLGFMLLGLTFSEPFAQFVTSVFNRDPTFTGRTYIWHAVIDAASKNPLLGFGYGSYWGLQDALIYSTQGVRESHSGWLDVYLEGGMVGILLLVAFIVTYYRKALRQLDYSYDWGLFGICILIMSMIHNFTESNFLRTSSYFWNVTVFITIVFSAPCLDKKKVYDQDQTSPSSRRIRVGRRPVSRRKSRG